METIERKIYGMVHPGDLLDRKHEVSIYLDGEDVTSSCACADDELGFVVLFKTKPRTIDPTTGRVGRVIRFGDVQIFACEKDSQ